MPVRMAFRAKLNCQLLMTMRISGKMMPMRSTTDPAILASPISPLPFLFFCLFPSYWIRIARHDALPKSWKRFDTIESFRPPRFRRFILYLKSWRET
jgi:hypothetical protein